MSKQLALSAAVSIFAMAGFAFLVVPATAGEPASATSLFSAGAPTRVVPSLGTLLPGLR